MRPAGASVARWWYDGGHNERGHHAGALGDHQAARSGSSIFLNMSTAAS
jgi:hypothetical protein